MRLIVFIVFCTTVGHDSSPPPKERGLLCPYTPMLLFDLKAIYYPMICRKALTLAYMRGIIVSSGDAARMLHPSAPAYSSPIRENLMENSMD